MSASTDAAPWPSEAAARALYATGDAAHDFDHVLRVTRLADRIAQAEGADRTVVRLAALLHDLPVPTAARSDHHRAAAAAAAHLLTTHDVPAPVVARVVHAIEAHRFRHRSTPPQTLEAQCLYDADKLDAIGAIGIGRAFAYAGAHGSRLWTAPWSAISATGLQASGPEHTPVHEYVYKLRNLSATLHTASARRLAADRHTFMARFFDQLDAEMQGDR
jgi:uncharacterized protein